MEGVLTSSHAGVVCPACTNVHIVLEAEHSYTNPHQLQCDEHDRNMF